MEEDAAAELVDPIAAVEEVDAVARGTGFSFSRALTLVFSAKESAFKCLFPQVQRYFDFRDAAIVSADPTRAEFVLQLLVTLTPSLPAGERFRGRFEHDAELVRTAMTLGAS